MARGIGDQPRLQEQFVGRLVAEFGTLLLERLDRFWIVHPGFDVVGGAHRGARPQERRKSREAEPGFVPQEDQVRLDGETFLHHPARVVDVAVERAVGQVDHLDPVQPVLALQVEQRLLDGFQRHRAVHRVCRHRKCFDVKRLGTRQHHSVVMRFVAVAVDDHDVAGTDQRLHRHLVRCRRSVGDEENAVGTKCPRRLLLCSFDIAGRLEQTVQAAGGGAALRQEEIYPVKFSHVPDPVRLEHGFAARDRQRMECSDRALGVFLQIVEERGFEPVLHAFLNGQMQLQQFFHGIEDAAKHVGLGISGQLLDVPVRHQIEVEFGAHAL